MIKRATSGILYMFFDEQRKRKSNYVSHSFKGGASTANIKRNRKIKEYYEL
jgi:hypothetical protein